MPPFSRGEKKGVSMRKGFLCFGLVVAAACGGGTNNNNGSQDMAPIQAPTEDLAGPPGRDGGGGGGDIDMSGTVQPGTGTPEAEGVDEHVNDSTTGAQTIAVNETIDGVTGNPDATNDAPDVDYFKFTATAGEVYRVTLSARGDYRPFAQITDGNMYTRTTEAGATTSTTRELFIPVSGTYYFLVTDHRNVDAANSGDPWVGGAMYAYSLKLEKVTPSPMAVTLPIANQADTIGSTNQVKIYSFGATSGTRYVVNVAAAVLMPASNVDTIVYLMDASGATPIVVGENDDIGSMNTDSAIQKNAMTTGTHWVVVDHYSSGATKTFQLSITTGDANGEAEPNDSRPTATDIATPATIGATTTMNGAINPTAAGARDPDYYAFTAAAGDYFEVTVTPGTGSPMIPLIAAFDPAGSTTFLNLNTVQAKPARLEVYAFTAGRHTIVVEDQRNNKSSGPYVGDTTHTYTISIKKIARTVNALGDAPIATGTQGKLTQGGTTIWYSFSIPGGAPKLTTIDLDLSTSAGANGFNLAPYMDLFDSTGATVASAATVFFRDVALQPGTYTLAVTQLNGDSSANNHGFRPRVLTSAIGTGTSTTNTARATAFDASAGGAWLVRSNIAATTGGGEAWFNLGTLNAGTTINLATLTPAGGTEIDVTLAITDSAGTVVGTVIDRDYQEVNTFSIATTQVYYARVKGYDQNVNGMFDFRVLPGICAAPATTGPFINEVMSQPTTQPADEFVELVNLTANAMPIGGFTIRDASGTRFRAACDATVPASSAIVVYGECSTGGCLQANVDPDAPTGTIPASDRLGLDDPGELVLFTDNNGRILDRVVLGAATANTSFARGTGGTCDVTPTTPPVVQLHTACTGQVGGSSPGQKANRTAFP
jgi:hypothetical protein